MMEADLFVDLLEHLRRIEAYDLVRPVAMRAIELYPLDVNVIRQWAIHHNELNDHDAAISLYEKALHIDPRNLRCLAELAMLKKVLGGRGPWQSLVQDCLKANALSPADEYFVGLAHFLDGRGETARFHYARSQQSVTCAGWLYYAGLVD